MRRSVRAWGLLLASMGFLWALARPVSGLAGTTAATDGRAPQVDIPVRKVVLYSSGVGYFEHMGSVTGHSGTELRFKTNQINDILKSLVLQDLDGGKVGTIVYPSQDPLAKTECDQNLWDAVGESIGRTPGVESHRILDDYR